MAKILVEVSGAVRTVTLNRPEKRNALDAEMLTALEAAFREPPAEAERVAVVRAKGQIFCSGLDLKDRAGTLDRPGQSAIEGALHAIEHYPLPVVAVVEGDAITGGNEIAMHCDFVVASTEASFVMSVSQIGLAPTWFLAKKILEVAGPVAAREMLMLGNPLPAARMHELGLIARVAPPDELEAEVHAIVSRLAANAPLSLRAIKATLVRLMAFRDGIDHSDTDALVEVARQSNDTREGIAARMEKRQPAFRGR